MGVVLFFTSAAAFRAEKLLQKTGMIVRLIPPPRHLSSDCGIALRFPWDQEGAVREILQTQNIEMAGIYPL